MTFAASLSLFDFCYAFLLFTFCCLICCDLCLLACLAPAGAMSVLSFCLTTPVLYHIFNKSQTKTPNFLKIMQIFGLAVAGLPRRSEAKKGTATNLAP
jgi:hypothetical protein